MAIQAELFVAGEGSAHRSFVRWDRNRLLLMLVLVVSAINSD